MDVPNEMARSLAPLLHTLEKGRLLNTSKLEHHHLYLMTEGRPVILPLAQMKKGVTL